MKDSSSFEVLDYSPPGTEYNYLKPRETITIEMDSKCTLPIIHFSFDGWLPNSVRLWPENSIQREKFLILERTPLSSPNVSSTSSDYESGYDIVL